MRTVEKAANFFFFPARMGLFRFMPRVLTIAEK